MIKAVGFDYGDVIQIHPGSGSLELTAEVLGMPLEEFRHVYFQYNNLTNVEDFDYYEMFRKVLNVLNVSKEREDAVIAMLEKRWANKKINTELVDLFPKLHALGLKVGILSNSASWLREELNKSGIAKLVDAIVISGEIGFQKPDKEAFQILFDALGVQAEELIFVDDSTRSLSKSDEIGYTPIRFKNNEQLFADLRNLGIPV